MGQCERPWTDPTAGALSGGNSPRGLDWIHRLLGPRADGAFETWTALAPTLMPILTRQVGRQFWTWTLANEKALADGGPYVIAIEVPTDSEVTPWTFIHPAKNN